LKEELRLLIELQKIDTDIGKINLKKKDLPAQLAVKEEAFAVFKGSLKEAQDRLDEATTRHKETEDKLKKAVDSLRKAKDKLHEVKTNKEYHAALKEIEGMEKKNGEIEEGIIALFDEIDAARAALKVKEKDVAEEQARHDAECKTLREQIDAIVSDLDDRMEKGEALRKDISPDLLRKYDKIRDIRNGVAVVSAWKEVCNGCHMNLPPQLYNELITATDLMICPQCNRIIFWVDQNVNDA
jgi:predicted  nucleic acid-binding Zn-ribbon protein